MASTLRNRNVVVAEHRTSLRLEPEFWSAFESIARAEGASVKDLVGRAQERERGQTGSVRVFILQWFVARLTRPTLAAMATTGIGGPVATDPKVRFR